MGKAARNSKQKRQVANKDGYFFRSFLIKNYQVLSDLKLPELGRVNVISGKNGVGKTSLLEALFIFIDRNPIAVLRPGLFREVPLSAESDIKRLFSNGQQIEFSAETRYGDEKVTLTYDRVPPPPEFQVAVSKSVKTFSADSGPLKGVITNQFYNKQVYYRLYSVPDGPLGMHAYVDQKQPPTGKAPAGIAAGTFLGLRSRNNLPDMATRYTDVVKSGRESELFNFIKKLQPDLQKFKLLTIENVPVLHAEISDNKIIPIQFLGDGTFSLISMTLAVLATNDGVVLIDEIDAGLHYTIQYEVWKYLIALSLKSNCQIIASTHSNECLNAFKKAIEEVEGLNAKFIRLNKIEGNVVATTYNLKDFSAALEGNWEVR